MTGEDIVELLLVVALVVLPALAITARLAMKPIVDAILRLHEGLVTKGGPIPGSGAEVRQLREQLQLLEARVAELQESEAFYRQLRMRRRATLEGRETGEEPEGHRPTSGVTPGAAASPERHRGPSARSPAPPCSSAPPMCWRSSRAE